MDLMARVKAKKQALSNSADHAKLKQGQANIIRILPSWLGVGEEFFADWGIHWVKHPGEDKAKAVHMCLAKTLGEDCPICDALAAGSRAASSEEETKALKESGASQRMLFNVIMYGQGKDTEPQILEVAGGVAADIFTLMEDFGDITHPETGRNITITATGSGIATRYTVMPAKDATAIDPSLYAKPVNLTEHVMQADKAKLIAAVSAVGAITGTYTDSAPVGALGSSAPAASLPSAASSMPSADFDDGMDMMETTVMPAETVGVPAVNEEDMSVEELKAKWAADMAAKSA